MFSAIYQGIGIGLGLSVLIGPVFFALIQTSINKGFKTALYLALGISLSDLFYIFLTLLGVESFLGDPHVAYYLGLIGGIILIVFGLQSVFKKVQLSNSEEIVIDSKHIFKSISKGFLLNSLHPGVMLFWLATVSGIVGKSDFTLSEVIILFTCTIISNFCIDLIKIKLADKLSPLLTNSLIKKLNIGVGFILIVCGFFLFLTTFLK